MTFHQTLDRHRLQLLRADTTTLQVNTGLRCDLACRHCHLDAGPHRSEMISPAVMADIVAFAGRARLTTIDITGGAPELVPGLASFLAALAPHCQQLTLRTNLTALANPADSELLDVCQAQQVTLIASLPAPDGTRTNAQRGQGIWERSLAMLRRLNARGYGQPGSELSLYLVSSPTGAFLAPSQNETDRRYRRELGERHGIAFTGLFAMSNAPLGRFRQWLESSGNLHAYCQHLEAGFNPAALAKVMCRSYLSVDWCGELHDCDFNLAAGLGLGNRRINIRELDALPTAGEQIAVGEHCFACCAGSGFTCGGEIAS